MITIQGTTSVAYNYESIENLDKIQASEETASTEVEKNEVQALPLAQTKPLDTAEAIEKSRTESADYSQKIKDKIVASAITDQDAYLALAIELKKTIEHLLGSVTEEDVKNVVKEHFNPEKISLELFAKVIDQNKMAVKVNDIEQLKKDVDVQVKQFSDKFPDEKTLKQVITSLKEHNLPINQKNIEKVLQVLQKVEEIKDVPSGAIVNVIKQDKALTVENVYKAKFMSIQPLKEDGSLKALEPQIKQMLKEEGLPTSKDMLELSKLLVQSDVPLDHATFEKVKILKNELNKIEASYVIDEAAENLAQKKSIGDIPIVQEASVISLENNAVLKTDQLTEIIEQIPKIEVTHINQVVRNYQEINLAQLFKARPEMSSEIAPLDPSQDLQVIKASLNLQEIRLKMTLEAATRLSDKGINIEVEPLEDLVSQLRTLERESYAKQLELGSIPATQENVNQVQDVLEQVNQLRNVSPRAVVKVMNQEIDFTIKAISNESRRELLLESAMKNYEVLGTKPRGDLGDSIEKTFSRLDETLKEIGVEPTESSIRAAKVLAKNEMPLTQANVDAVMMIDSKVRRVTESLHPNVVVQMIKDQLSPVDLHIDEVLNYASNFEKRLGATPDENFAKAIVELDNNKELTPIERESLVGIYRMFSTVSKSKGTAVGFLMKNDLPLKLDNLFEAAKFIKKTKGDKQLIDTDINDDFGLLKEVKYDGKNIKQQIETALHKTTIAPTDPHIQLAQALDEAGINLDEQHLNKAGLSHHSLEELFDKATFDKMVALTKEGFLKDKNLSVEKFAQQLSNMPFEPTEDGQEVLKSLKTLGQIDLETLKNLDRYGLDKNLNNLLTAHEIAKKPFELSHQLNRIMKALENQQVDTAPLKELLHRSTEGHAVKDYEKTLSDLKEQLNNCNQDLLNSQSLDKGPLHKTIADTTQILDYQKAIHKGDAYYQIPMMLHGKMTQINMYYFGENKQHKTQEDQDVTNIYLYFDTEHLGKVQANVRLEKNSIDFSMCSSNTEDLEFIQSFGDKIKVLLNNTDYQVNKIHYGFFEGKSPIQEAIKEPVQESPKKHKNSQFETTV